MPELPASVRLALWATAALTGRGVSVEQAVLAATPDIPDVDTAQAVARIDLWAQLGERVVLVALPAPGDLVGVPRGDAEFLGAALEAGECSWSPLAGGAVVPTVERFGPDGDQGEIVRWESFDCSTPVGHDPGGVSTAQIERALRTILVETTDALESLDAAPWRAGLRDLADERLAPGRWGLPPGIAPRTHSVLAQAATILTIAETALESLHDAPSLAVGAERSRLLRSVHGQARRTLASAACAAGLELAGQENRR